jgi:hypothetical protein
MLQQVWQMLEEQNQAEAAELAATQSAEVESMFAMRSPT